jgi:hypothetical protein
MSVSSSMQVTVGSALSRAWDQGQTVDVLVGGHWFSGLISNLDGMGVAIDGENFERYVIRLDQVGAVRIRTMAAGTSLPALDISA